MKKWAINGTTEGLLQENTVFEDPDKEKKEDHQQRCERAKELLPLWLSSGADSSPDAGLLHTSPLIYRYEPSARYPTLSALNLCCFQEWSLLLLLCFMPERRRQSGCSWNKVVFTHSNTEEAQQLFDLTSKMFLHIKQGTNVEVIFLPRMVWFGLLTAGPRVAIPVAVINYPLMHTNGDPGQRRGRT